MAKKCYICGKRPLVGYNVSHANNKTKKRSQPNLQKTRAKLPSGKTGRITVCTRCLRSGAVKKPEM